VFKGLMGSHV